MVGCRRRPSPQSVLAFLMVIAVEALIDLVLEVGVPAILDVMAIGAIV
jgi:hypothetical protein